MSCFRPVFDLFGKCDPLIPAAPFCPALLPSMPCLPPFHALPLPPPRSPTPFRSCRRSWLGRPMPRSRVAFATPCTTSPSRPHACFCRMPLVVCVHCVVFLSTEQGMYPTLRKTNMYILLEHACPMTMGCCHVPPLCGQPATLYITDCSRNSMTRSSPSPRVLTAMFQ